MDTITSGPYKKGEFVKNRQSGDIYIIIDSCACFFNESCKDSAHRQHGPGASALPAPTEQSCPAIVLHLLKIKGGPTGKASHFRPDGINGNSAVLPILHEVKMTCCKYFEPATKEDLSNDPEREANKVLPEDAVEGATTI